MKHSESLKSKIFRVLDDHKSRRPLNRLFHGILFTLIILSSSLLILESLRGVYAQFKPVFYFLEMFAMVFFTIEYILRVYTCTETAKFHHPIRGRISYVFTFLMLVDLMSLIPFYLLLFSSDYSGFYIFSVFRVLRLFKAIRYINAFRVIGRVFYLKREQLLVSMIFILFVFIFASSVMYIAEKDAQPDKFSDIPSAMWYTIITITSVGYGDVYPVTPIGKLTGGLLSMTGLVLFALPTSILTSGFLKINQSHRRKTCPHCGEEINIHELK